MAQTPPSHIVPNSTGAMAGQSVDSGEDSQDLSFSAIGRALAARWRFLLAVTMAWVLIALVVVQLQKPLYQANMVVAPTLPPSKTETSSLLGGGGLSSLLNNGTPMEVSDFSEFTTLLTSPELAARLESKHHILPILFSDAWDPRRHDWKERSGPVAAVKDLIKIALHMPPSRHPDIHDLAKRLDEIVTIGEVGRTGLRTISLRSTDPKLAQSLLELISTEADAVVRGQELQRSSAYIEFLRGQLQQVTLNEQKQALTAILATQERSRMLSSVDMSFSYKLVEAPRVQPDPVEPQPIRTLALAAVWGLILGVMIVFAQMLWVSAYGRRTGA